jgi:predicted AAA+ superfamily ATPase
MFTRLLLIQDIENESVFLWGARQTGKSTLLKNLFPKARYFDLLKSDDFERFNRRPALLREELEIVKESEIIIIDEIQKVPQLLDEVQWLIVNRNLRFILSGSSARKLKRSGANLLGGRAISNKLFPLVSAEIPDFNLIRAVNNGMLPRHYIVENAQKRLQAYIGDYLQEEIRAEALIRNLASFTRFLEVAAITSGEIVNYLNIASECGVSSPTIKEYFSILEETLIGYMIPAFTEKTKRRVVQAPRFYYFDVGIVNYLLKRRLLQPGSADFGKAFEHLIIQEIIAYLRYSENENQLSYWRTSSGYEVDVVIGKAKVAIEIKSSKEVQSNHTKGLKAFIEEFPETRSIIVSLDKNYRLMNGLEIIPAELFLKKLWSGEIV